MTLKDQLLREALRQFSTKGYTSTSTGSIISAVGASKGGLYNHFKNKEQLSLEALSLARKIWREKNLYKLDEIDRPLDQIAQLLKNYKDRYLTASDTLPGGCIFVNLAVEVSDEFPRLGREIREGFTRLKRMLERLLKQEKALGTLEEDVDPKEMAELIFSTILGACVMYSADKSQEGLDITINSLCRFIDSMKK